MNMKRMYNPRFLIAMLVALAIAPWPALLEAQSVASSSEVSDTLAIQHLAVKNNVVSGEIVNRSPHRIRDVELLVQYHWLWRNEFHPGKNPPGRAAYVELDKEIPPGGTLPFTYAPKSTLASSKDGHFMHEVSIAGFTVVVMPKAVSTR